MIKTPIVFSFNDGFIIPATVCITSLLENANENTFYDIFILHSSSRLSIENKNLLLKLETIYPKSKISFIDLLDKFNDGFETRGITIDTYYRFAIEEYITDYEKVIYSDVDIIFNEDVSDCLNINENYSIYAVDDNFRVKTFDNEFNEKNRSFNAGFLVMNLKKIREENSIELKIKPLFKQTFNLQDQAMLNIAYQNDVFYLGYEYNYMALFYGYYYKLGFNINPKVIHFSGPKPWEQTCPMYELWWMYYKKSIFFDNNSYLKFIYKNLEGYKSTLFTGKNTYKSNLYNSKRINNYILRFWYEKYLFKTKKLIKKLLFLNKA